MNRRSCEGHRGFERRCQGSPPTAPPPQRSTRITEVITQCRYRSASCCSASSLCGVRNSLPALSDPTSLRIDSVYAYMCIYMTYKYSVYSRYIFHICVFYVHNSEFHLPFPGAQWTPLSVSTPSRGAAPRRTDGVKLEAAAVSVPRDSCTESRLLKRSHPVSVCAYGHLASFRCMLSHKFSRQCVKGHFTSKKKKKWNLVQLSLSWPHDAWYTPLCCSDVFLFPLTS